MSVSYPTVVISALTGLNNETNPNEFLQMTAVETSWMGELSEKFTKTMTKLIFNAIFIYLNEIHRFNSILGSIGYVGKLFGSLICGFSSEHFGRRKSMILINLPHLVAFYLFYYSTTVWRIFVANILLGFGAGFLKAPSSTYVGEIR